MAYLVTFLFMTVKDTKHYNNNTSTNKMYDFLG